MAENQPRAEANQPETKMTAPPMAESDQPRAESNQPLAKTSTHDNHKHSAGSGDKVLASRFASKHPRRCAFCTFMITFLFLVGITALIVWLVYRPHKPKFRVVSAAIYAFNMSLPLFSTTMQFTIVIRNPNDRISIYYDHLSTFVLYKNQPITPPLMLPPLFQEKDSTVVLSAVLGGADVPVSAEVAKGLIMDEAYGVVGLRLVFLGKLKWKAGAMRTGPCGILAKCDMLVGLKRGFVGQVPLLGAPQCKVDI